MDISPDLTQVEVSDETLEALDLRSAGLTVRDIAQLLGVTPSRISQIEKQATLANSA